MINKLYIILIIFLLPVSGARGQLYNESTKEPCDSVKTPPIIDVKPTEFEVTEDETGFITRHVKVLNRGGTPLQIRSVTGSCGCSKASVQSGVIHPLTVGKIILFINVEGLYGENRTVEYVIESNAQNSPVSVRIHVDEKIIKRNEKKKE